MYYSEFKDSALRHLKTSKCLQESLRNCEKDKKHILSNIYYLSGYILETILKYEIFHSINYDKKKSIESLNQNGIKFKDIKIHNLSTLKLILESKAHSPYRLKEFDKNRIFFKNWEHQIRYKKSRDITEGEVVDFLNFAEINFNNIKYRKLRS